MFPERHHLEDIIHFLWYSSYHPNLLTTTQNIFWQVHSTFSAVQKSPLTGKGSFILDFHQKSWSTKRYECASRLRVTEFQLFLFYICQFARYAFTQDFYSVKFEFKYSKFSQWTQTLEHVLHILRMANGLSEEFQCPCIGKGIAGSPWSHAEAESGQQPPSAHLTYLLVPVQLCWWWGRRGWCAADPLLDKRARCFGEADSR